MSSMAGPRSHGRVLDMLSGMFLIAVRAGWFAIAGLLDFPQGGFKCLMEFILRDQACFAGDEAEPFGPVAAPFGEFTDLGDRLSEFRLDGLGLERLVEVLFGAAKALVQSRLGMSRAMGQVVIPNGFGRRVKLLDSFHQLGKMKGHWRTALPVRHTRVCSARPFPWLICRSLGAVTPLQVTITFAGTRHPIRKMF